MDQKRIKKGLLQVYYSLQKPFNMISYIVQPLSLPVLCRSSPKELCDNTADKK
jgi:hypothetical protein